MYDVIVIGAGTAGMSSALYSARGGMHTLVLEKQSYGGQIVVSPEVENYPGIAKTSGFAFAQGLYEQMLQMGVEYKSEGVTEVVLQKKRFLVTTEERQYEAKSVIVATGLTKRKLQLPLEETLTGHGISYCATCDGAFFRKKQVGVNGGGNTALEDALFLSQYCEKVFLIHRREEFRGEQFLVEQLKQCKNVEFLMPYKVVELAGTQQLKGIVLEQTVTGEKSSLQLDGLFVAIGQIPENQIVAGLVELDEGGYIVAGEDTVTSVAGLYAAGDCRTKEVRQLTTAAADGAIAGVHAIRYVKKQDYSYIE